MHAARLCSLTFRLCRFPPPYLDLYYWHPIKVNETQSSSEDDSETERLKEEERKKEEEKNSTVNGAPSGASSQGTPTQSGRSENHGSSQMTNGLSLKRPGSPNLSEASGSESTRKRIKKQHKDASGQSSRAMSPSGISAARSASRTYSDTKSMDYY